VLAYVSFVVLPSDSCIVLPNKLKHVSVAGFNVFVIWKRVIFEVCQVKVYMVEDDVHSPEFVDLKSCILDVMSLSSPLKRAVTEAKW